MKRMEIRGIIVSSMYDDSFFDSYIQKGIITPESRFRKALAECTDDDALDVYINSPGGSVFSANEMINAPQEWRATARDGRKGPRQVTITIGSLAASMGAVMAISAGDTRRMHRNGKLMFHSAWSGCEGGPEAMKDEAALLDKINADIMAVLVGRFGCNPDTVAEWFKEGRMGWLSAQDAKEMGLIDEIIGEDAPAGATVEFPEAAALAAKGLKIAACAGVLEVLPAATVTPIPPPAGGEVSPLAPPEPAGGFSIDAAITAATQQRDALQARIAALEVESAKHKADAEQFIIERDKARNAQAGADRKATEALAALALATTEHTAAVAKLREEHASQISERDSKIQQTTQQNETYATRLQRLTGAVLTATPDDNGDEPASWAEAMKRCGGMTDAAHAEAARKWPKLLERYLKAAGARKAK
jgi:ATP-dependent protease ClpP protease subunit